MAATGKTTVMSIPIFTAEDTTGWLNGFNPAMERIAQITASLQEAGELDKASLEQLTQELETMTAKVEEMSENLAGQADDIQHLTTDVANAATAAQTATANSTQAINTADSANSTAGEAISAASDAEVSANQAKTSAQEAKTVANNATTIATRAESKANESISSVSELRQQTDINTNNIRENSASINGMNSRINKLYPTTTQIDTEDGSSTLNGYVFGNIPLFFFQGTIDANKPASFISPFGLWNVGDPISTMGIATVYDNQTIAVYPVLTDTDGNRATLKVAKPDNSVFNPNNACEISLILFDGSLGI